MFNTAGDLRITSATSGMIALRYQPNLIKSLPPTLKYEHGAIVAEGSFVMVHKRFSNFGIPTNWIAADIVRIENGMLAEHWDVIEDEVSKQASQSGLPMFGEEFSK